MEKKNQMRALEIILDAVNPGGSISSAHPVKVGIGHVDETNHCNSDTIVLNWSPPSVIDALRKEGFNLTMTEHGLMVDKW